MNTMGLSSVCSEHSIRLKYDLGIQNLREDSTGQGTQLKNVDANTEWQKMLSGSGNDQSCCKSKPPRDLHILPPHSTVWKELAHEICMCRFPHASGTRMFNKSVKLGIVTYIEETA